MHASFNACAINVIVGAYYLAQHDPKGCIHVEYETGFWCSFCFNGDEQGFMTNLTLTKA